MKILRITYIDGSVSPEYGIAGRLAPPDGMWVWELYGGARLVVRPEQVRALHFYEIDGWTGSMP